MGGRIVAQGDFTSVMKPFLPYVSALNRWRVRPALLAAVISLAQAQVVGPDHTSYTGNETLGSGRLDTTGTVVFNDTSSAGTGLIVGRGSTRVFFRGNSTADRAQFTFTTLNHADRNILSFEGRSSAGSARVSYSGLGLADVEFADQADGPDLRINSIHGLDISGASTGTGTTGRTRATTLDRTPVSVVADDARTVAVGFTSANVVALGSNTLQIGGGSLRLITDVGVYQSGSGQTMTGGGLVKVGPGTLDLFFESNTFPYAVPLEVREGLVSTFRQWLGRTTVGPAGTLRFSSNVLGDLANAGRLEVSIGTNRQITGNFTQGASGTLALTSTFLGVQFSPTQALMVGGTATLAGRLEVAGPGTTNQLAATMPATRTLLTAGSVVGRFDTVVLNSAPRLRMEARYTPTAVNLDFSLRPYSDFGVTTAGRAMGRHLDTFADDTTNIPFPLRSLVTQMNAIPAASLTAAIESLVPDVYGSALEGALQVGPALQRSVARQLAAPGDRPRGFSTMFAGQSRRSRFDALAGLPAAEDRASGGMAGVSGYFRGVTAGLFVAQEDGDTTLDANGSAAAREMLSFSLAARYAAAGWHAQVIAAAGRGGADVRRLVGTPGQGPLPRGSTDTSLRLYAGEIGYGRDMGRWRVGVNAGYTSTTVQWDDFAESNGLGSELALGGLDFASRRLHAGVQAGIRLAREKLRLRVSVTAGRELERDRGFFARLAGAPAYASFYAVPGRPADRDSLEAGLEAEWHITPNLVLGASYAGARGDHSRVTGDFSAGFRWSF